MAVTSPARWLIALVAVAGLVGLGMLGVWWPRTVATTTSGPIIFISIDTLRADHLPAYGYDKVRTPTIDALAADGIVFERAYAHSPQTLPSHASILSGRLPFETGVRDNIGFALGRSIPTLPVWLRTRGYASGAVASAFVLRRETGIGHGFDFFDATMPIAGVDQQMAQISRSGMDSLDVATRWMSGLASTRFFLLLHLYEPHAPYEAPARFAQYAPYDGEIAWSDEVIGRLLGWLKARDWYNGATIVLLSDHGEGLGDHGELEHGLFLYNETMRAPLVRRRRRPARTVRTRRSPAMWTPCCCTGWRATPKHCRFLKKPLAVCRASQQRSRTSITTWATRLPGSNVSAPRSTR